MNAPTPLDLTAGIEREELGGGALADIPPDRFPDHLGANVDRVMNIRWMTDRSGHWSKLHAVSLGKTGQERMDRKLQPMGQYRARQFEFIFSDACKFSICGIEDDIAGLE